MKRFIFVLFFLLLCKIQSFSQSEGWASSCLSNTPKVSEIMIDAYGTDEFYSEYIILRTGNQPFNIKNLSYKVINPFNNAFIGSVKIEDNNTNYVALNQLTSGVGNNCRFGTVFRDVFAMPYNGIVPPNSAILIFNNKDSVDLSYLPSNAFASLCGSKVFVAFGTIKAQSPGVSIFRNHPRNGSCGTTGCLRQIQFQFEGPNAPFCTQITYDFKNLPHLNTSNPPDGYGDGSYIRPKSDGTIEYGGGNLTGNGIPIPPLSMLCQTPTQPDFGAGFWNVSVYDGLNNFTNFTGFYQAKGNHEPSVAANSGSFEYNTERDGWKIQDSPSEAHTTYGALASFDGCNVKSDSFSMIAKRKGFTCANYDIRLIKYDDFLRFRIDTNGDGTWEFDQSFNSPACSSGCGTDIWQGALNSDSKIEIWGYDINKDFKTHIIFNKKPNSASPININSIIIPTVCGTSMGNISLNITGGIAPYSIQWKGATSIAHNSTNARNLTSGVYQVNITDSKGCRDSTQILVNQINGIIADAGKDTSYCAGGSAILRGISNIPNSQFEWTNLNGQLISNQATISVSPSISTYYILKVSDTNGCFDTDTVFVKVNDLPFLTLTVSTSDTICNDAVPNLKVKGAQSYIWSSFPQIASSALSSTTGDSVFLFTLLLAAPQYLMKVEGTDAFGCKNTAQTTLVINPLPVVTIQPVKDTLCTNDAPLSLIGTPTTGGKYSAVRLPLANACVGCIVGNTFYPNISGVGTFTISHELISNTGCKNAPSIEINVKKCNTCVNTDTTKLQAFSCNPSVLGISERILANKAGCDSVVITTTSLSFSDTTIINQTSCNPNKTGQQVFKKLNINGCDSVIIVNTNLILSNIKYTLNLLKSISCTGGSDGSIELKNITGGTPQYKINWSNGDTSSILKNLKAGIYPLTLTDSEGCIQSDSVLISEPLPLSMAASGIPPKCFNDEIGSIQVSQLLGGTGSYSLFLDDSNKNFNTLPFTLPNVKVGNHILKLTDKNNCTTDTAIQIKTGRQLIVELGSNVTLNQGDSVTLNAFSNFPHASIKWVSNDSSICKICLPITVSPLKTTTYNLIIKDSLGCQSSDNITVFINKQERVFIPTSFSPNDDGINDVFTIYTGKNVKTVKSFKIFNRWGNLVFESSNYAPNDISKSWDGIFNGNPLPSDVFIYYTIIEFVDGKIEIYQGDVTLMR
jgi:gliding motility-associated-like protein